MQRDQLLELIDFVAAVAAGVVGVAETCVGLLLVLV